MKRTPGKIKDFVEAQSFDAIGNYAADPVRALAAYRFTEATAELLVRWIDALAEAPRGIVTSFSGTSGGSRTRARALAGPRGAGKSHTLAVLSTVLACPDLRPTLADAQIAAAARGLGSRHFTIIRVERGTRPTLEEEIIQALDRTLGAPVSYGTYLAPHAATDDAARDGVNARFVQPLAIAASRLGDAPLVFVIDSAYGRAERVARDDGMTLTELAAAARHANAFVLVALDDDIAGADGANSVLARDFQIDYLDPEHLLRVADLFMLRKTPAGRIALREIYASLRESVAGFNWAETRFAALYPVHPIVAESASAVRLYAPGFALLPFAAEAAQRAAGRPPHSLVTLDEVFDRAEYDLRRAAPLADVFAAYDDLAARAVAQMPVMERLRARLILKALFVLSLDGRGATASEVCTTLLFEDEPGSDHAIRTTEEALMMFAATSESPATAADSETKLTPKRPIVERVAEEAGWRYRFQINLAESFEQKLQLAIESLTFDDAAANRVLREAASRRFPDLPPTSEADSATDMFLLWRGTHRAGRFIVLDARTAGQIETEAAGQHTDEAREIEIHGGEWRVVLLPVRLASTRSADDCERARIDSGALELAWRPAELRDDEREELRRCLALTHDEQLANEYAEQAQAALAASAHALDRVWTRLYIDEGRLIRPPVAALVEESDPLGVAPVDAPTETAWSSEPLSAEARAAPTLARMLSNNFDPYFAARYPAHPEFAEPFGEREVTRLASNLFGGADTHDPATQRDARSIAAPLALVDSRDDAFALKTNDELLATDSVRAVLSRVQEAEGGAVSLAAVREVLGASPFGYTADSRHLVLAALVASRRLEFTTTIGERFARRALAARVKWAEITGVIRASDVRTSDEELTAWARLLVGSMRTESSPANIDADIDAEFERLKSGATITDSTTRERLRRELTAWLDDWDGRRTLARCELLPDSWLTIRNGNLVQAVRRTSGVAASAVRAYLGGEIELEECLQRVADAFAAAPAFFVEAQRRKLRLDRFVDSFERLEIRRRYLLGVEQLSDPDLDVARRRCLDSLEDSERAADDDTGGEDERETEWNEFRDRYAEIYVAIHDAAANCDEEHRLLDALVRSPEWRELEALAELPSLGANRLRKLRRAVRESNHARCTLAAGEVAALLRTQPVCVCGFRLGGAAAALDRARELGAAVPLQLAAYKRTLAQLAAQLAEALGAYAEAEIPAGARDAARVLAHGFGTGRVPDNLTSADIEIMRAAIKSVPAPPPLRVELPVSNHELLTPAELDARVRQWLDELPGDIHILSVGDARTATRTT